MTLAEPSSAVPPQLAVAAPPENVAGADADAHRPYVGPTTSDGKVIHRRCPQGAQFHVKPLVKPGAGLWTTGYAMGLARVSRPLTAHVSRETRALAQPLSPAPARAPMAARQQGDQPIRDARGLSTPAGIYEVGIPFAHGKVYGKWRAPSPNAGTAAWPSRRVRAADHPGADPALALPARPRPVLVHANPAPRFTGNRRGRRCSSEAAPRGAKSVLRPAGSRYPRRASAEDA